MSLKKKAVRRWTKMYCIGVSILKARRWRRNWTARWTGYWKIVLFDWSFFYSLGFGKNEHYRNLSGLTFALTELLVYPITLYVGPFIKLQIAISAATKHAALEIPKWSWITTGFEVLRRSRRILRGEYRLDELLTSPCQCSTCLSSWFGPIKRRWVTRNNGSGAW